VRIACFTDTYLPEINGVVTSLDAHTRLLAERGHEVLIICPKYRRPVLHIVPGVHVKRYRSFSFITNKDTRVALPSVASIVATLRRFDPDVVHIHTPLSVGVVGLVITRMLRLPNVQTYHTYIPDFMTYVELHRLLRLDSLQQRVVTSLVAERMFESGAWRRVTAAGSWGREAVSEVRETARQVLGTLPEGERVELTTRVAWQFTRNLYNRADVVLTPSATLRDELVRHGVTVPVEYLSNGIDTSVVAPKDDYAPTGRLIHAGRLGFEKNVDVVVGAFARLAGRDPRVSLDIVGDGPARETVARLAGRLGVADRVHMRGFMDRASLGRIYREYDAFVTASTIETQGIVLLEAMSAGLPVIGVDALAIPELVRHDRHGFIVPPGDEVAMADAAERLLADDGLRERMGRAARDDVQVHEVHAIVDRLEELYARVAATRSSR
jgi:glycosyltransferase involved in cell wall biosynthesis